uniref:F-box domain-containing protein n=1 Tax=Timema tahoe TaxID=61484 RepID=A0A7R9ILS2_9NEOP|nr:unnamed protein product [Timema tahoe]
MVSTRQSSNVGSGGENTGAVAETGAPKLKHSHAPPPALPGSSSPNNTANVDGSQTINLLDLPTEIVLKIFSYLSFRKVAHLRRVSHLMNSLCSSHLNSTFQRMQTQMLNRFQSIKAKMPRRESARRNHPLACESDIIETLHMRLTLLQMTFGKHIERKHCCFFAGEILDEVDRILIHIKVTAKLARPYKVTDELFDLSTMAMEYFKEHIEPTLPEIAYFSSDFLDFSGTFGSTSSSSKQFASLNSPTCNNTLKGDESPSAGGSGAEDLSMTRPPQSNMVLRKRIRKIKQGMKRCDSSKGFLPKGSDSYIIKLVVSSGLFLVVPLAVCPHQLNRIVLTMVRRQPQNLVSALTYHFINLVPPAIKNMYNSQLSLMRRDLKNCKGKIAEQQKQIQEYANRLDENDKKNEETSRKFSTLLQELNKCKTELQYWRSKSPANPSMCMTCGTVMAPVPSEDLQALANQGVLPEGLGLDFGPKEEEEEEGETLDFVPIAGTSNDADEQYWDLHHSWEAAQPDAADISPSEGKKNVATSTVTSATVANKLDDDNQHFKTPVRPVGPVKRKATDVFLAPGKESFVAGSPESKRQRRIHKSRSKRSKI